MMSIPSSRDGPYSWEGLKSPICLVSRATPMRTFFSMPSAMLLLGAIGEGDIGRHFPDTDSQYRDIRSTVLLKRVINKIKEKGFHLLNIDATIVAQKPKLSEFIPRMVKQIADVLEIETGKGQCESHNHGRVRVYRQGRRNRCLCCGAGRRIVEQIN